MKVYFLASGDIAVPVLDALVDSEKIELLGVGTQEDRPAGRKRKLVPTPVGKRAEELGIAVDKIPSVNEKVFIDRLKDLAPDILLVISFGQILKEEILNLPTIAPVNIHASLLPCYRGASPIAAALLNGDLTSGITYMQMDKGLDTGPVYLELEIPLDAKIKADELEVQMGRLCAETVEDVLLKIESGNLKPEDQDNSQATLTGKIRKADGRLDWNAPALELERKIRAFHPWPGVSFTLNTPKRDIVIRISEAEYLPELKGSPGEVLKANKKEWIVACAEGALHLKRIVPQGKNEMSGADFLRGCHIEENTLLC